MKQKPCLTHIDRELKLKENQRFRRSLPSGISQRTDYSVWEIIKPNLGKDFSRFSVPVFLNEPLSFLQRLAENMQYADLLEKAAKLDDPVDRIANVGAFAISAISSNYNRLSKPFNPLLLETYALERDGYRFVAEQVSHHPPVTACHAQGEGYELNATVSPQVSCGFNKLFCNTGSHYTIKFHELGETYQYDGPNCCIYNVMFGKMYMNITGTMKIRSSSGLELVFNFSSGKGWHFKTCDVHVDGVISDKPKSVIRHLYGNWSSFLAQCDPAEHRAHFSSYQKMFHEAIKHGDERIPLIPNSDLLWIANVTPKNFEKQYYLTYFALSLNELPADESLDLPPTDSRYRPDLRALENGKIDKAEKQKHLLEEAQRRRQRCHQGNTPRWFRSTGSTWVFNNEYWNRDWSESLDVFSISCSEDTNSG